MTPAQQKAYYAKNKADAKVKEDKALYEITGSRGDAARKGMEEGRMDAMGTAYKKGGKVMKKKIKRFEEGGYTGDDEIVKYRMGMIDAKGNDLTKSKKETVEDNDPYGATKKETSADLDPYNAASKSSTSETPKKATPKAESKPTPKAEPKFTPLTNKDEEGNKLPTDVKKPYIAIPKNAAGMQQYRSDAESPIGKLFKAITGSKSQRTTAAEKKMKSGGKVKSASARADGCAIRGKTRA